MKKYFLNFIIVFLTISMYSQNYPQNFRQPINWTLLVTGDCCEFRSNHFHGGLDLRTGTVGKKVYAIADGYVSRIKVSGGGYGNALYITVPQGDGYVVLYGHLLRYNSEISEWVKNFQNKIQEFQFDVELDSSVFPVKKGQVVAYSGSTGYSFGPHVHFEIRNIDNEPLNPQLFGYRISDTKPPIIRNIAIYPADDTSYVDYKNNSKVFQVNGSSVNQDITVHGDIYFGVEAYDYLNDVSSKNAIYKTMLYIDGKLIYHSEFNKYSYLHGRDVNTMVDYARRISTSHRIQRCYVSPNNQLYHYIQVENRGIVTFNDAKIHNVKFIVSDIYGNSTTANFKVKSSTYKKDFGIKRDSSKLLRYDTTNLFTAPGIEVFFPEKSIFENIFFKFYTSEGNIYSPIYHIHTPYVPLKDYYILSINITSVPEKLRNKAVICNIDYDGDIECYRGEVRDNYLSVFTRAFGKYYVDIDITKPKIKSVNLSEGANMRGSSSMKFKITDDLSGILDWAGFINGEWVLFKYDAKNDLLWYNFDDKTKSGKNTLTLLVTDGVKNIAEYKTYFYR